MISNRCSSCLANLDSDKSPGTISKNRSTLDICQSYYENRRTGLDAAQEHMGPLRAARKDQIERERYFVCDSLYTCVHGEERDPREEQVLPSSQLITSSNLQFFK